MPTTDETDPLGQGPIAADSARPAPLPALPDLDPIDAPRLRGQLQPAPMMVPAVALAGATLPPELPPAPAFELHGFDAPDGASDWREEGPVPLATPPSPIAFGGAPWDARGTHEVMTDREKPALHPSLPPEGGPGSLTGSESYELGRPPAREPVPWGLVEHPLLGPRPEPLAPHPWARYFHRTARDYRPFVSISFFVGIIAFAATGWVTLLLIFWLSAALSAVGVWVHRGDGTLD